MRDHSLDLFQPACPRQSIQKERYGLTGTLWNFGNQIFVRNSAFFPSGAPNPENLQIPCKGLLQWIQTPSRPSLVSVCLIRWAIAVYVFHADENLEQATLVSSLREIIQNQAAELDRLGKVAQQGPTFQDSPETLALVSSLEKTIQQQKSELDVLRSETGQKTLKFDEEVMCHP